MKYSEIQKIIYESEKTDWINNYNGFYFYKNDVLLTIEFFYKNERMNRPDFTHYHKISANFKYGNTSIESWNLLQAHGAPIGEIIPEPRTFFYVGEERKPFDEMKLDAVRKIFNQEDKLEKYDQAVTDLVAALEVNRTSE
jgi:hypothetical protein